MLYENKNCQIMTNTRLIFSSWQTSTSMGLTNYWSLKLPLKQLGRYMTQKKHRRFVGSLPVDNSWNLEKCPTPTKPIISGYLVQVNTYFLEYFILVTLLDKFYWNFRVFWWLDLVFFCKRGCCKNCIVGM